MLLLVCNVAENAVQLRARVRESPESFLPIKSTSHPLLLVNETRRTRLDIAHELRKRDLGTESKQDMDMVRHVVDSNNLLPIRHHDAGDVLLKFIIMHRVDKSLAPCTANTT